MLMEYQEFLKKLSAPDNDASIFHYTTEQGYSDICRTSYLKINSHLLLNEKDKKNNELQVAIDLIREKLQASSGKLKEYLYRYDKFISYGIIYYTLSFTKNRSPVLAKKYGNICFEFNALPFHQFVKKERATVFADVIYEVKKQREIIDEVFTIFDQLAVNDDAIIDLFLCLSLITPLLKSYEHRNDAECRIVQAEIFAPSDIVNPKEDGKLSPPIVTKQMPFILREILNVYRELK